MSVCSVGLRVGGAAVRIGACRKAEAVSPKANSSSSNPEAKGRRTNSPRATPKRCVPKAEVVSPKVNPPSGNLRSGRQKNQPAEQKRQLAEGNPEAVRAEKRKS